MEKIEKKLKKRLRSRDTVEYIHKWISSFLSQKLCMIIFSCSPSTMKGINTGITQSSPLSPNLFVIYIESLHACTDSTGEFNTSYIDNI